jgi:hypothetical protein
MATGTVIPNPVFTGIDSNGDPFSGGKLHTYAAGTTTNQVTYSNVGLTSANANPVVLDSAGRATIFTAVGTSFKYVLKNSSDVTIWTADNINAVPTSTATLDITVTAGEDLSALEAVYISQGDGSKTAGRAYLTDADTAYSSSSSVVVGVVVSDIANAGTGSVRVGGAISGYTGLTAGSKQYVSGTAGEITATAPTNVRLIGQANNTTTIVLIPVPTLIDASNIVSGTLVAARGGTGNAAYAVGDLLSASATTPTLSRVAAVAAGQVLSSAGTGTLPAWSATPSVTTITGGSGASGGNIKLGTDDGTYLLLETVAPGANRGIKIDCQGTGTVAVIPALAVTGVATLTAQPICSTLTASLPVFSDGSKGLVSNTMTGTGNVVMSTSPTLTGTIGAAAATFSGDVAVATSTLFVDASEDRVGIGTATPGKTLEIADTIGVDVPVVQIVNGSSGVNYTQGIHVLVAAAGVNHSNGFCVGTEWASKNAGSVGFYSAGDHSDSNYLYLGGHSNDDALKVFMDGSVSVPGALSKGSGSFRIRHPLPSMNATHELVHSFIEGPQCDLIYRGSATLVAGSASVNLDTASHMTEGTWLLLCRDEQCFTSNETGWSSVRGSVAGNILTIECEDATSTDTISWMVVAERHDQHIIDTPWTDDEGHVIVEPESVEVPGRDDE